MSLLQLLLSLGILGFILLTNLGVHLVTRWRIVLPLVLVGIVASVLPIAAPGGNDHLLETSGLLVGAILGIAAGLLAPARLDGAGRVVTAAGGAFAALWVVATAVRIFFAEGSTYLFAKALTSFSELHRVTARGWTSAFVDLALAMVLARVLVLGHQARRLAGGEIDRRRHRHPPARLRVR